MSAFKVFYTPTKRCPLRDIEKPSWSLWLNLCLKFTAQLRDLTDNCMCGLQRRSSHSKIKLNIIIAHRISPYNLLYDLLSKCILLNLFRLAITKGLNTYWLILKERDWRTIQKDKPSPQRNSGARSEWPSGSWSPHWPRPFSPNCSVWPDGQL